MICLLYSNLSPKHICIYTYEIYHHPSVTNAVACLCSECVMRDVISASSQKNGLVCYCELFLLFLETSY